MNECLILTSKEDAHADYIIDIINSNGLGDRIIRLNTEDFLENCIVEFDGKKVHFFIKDANRSFISDQLYSVWYRRPQKVAVNETDEGVRKFIKDQSESFLQNFYYLTQSTTRWVNPLLNLQQARYKFQQLALAGEIGLNVPKTLVTNNPVKALQFTETTKCVNKSLSKPFYHIGNEFYSYLTQQVRKEDVMQNQQSIQLCPTLFQEFIDKTMDIRIVYFDKQVFSFAIHSQTNEFSKIDFRGVSPHLLRHEKVTIPKELERKIIEFISQQGLLFSALDFVIDKKGQYFFIENNPNGQWVWLEYATDNNELSKAMVKLLLDVKL